MGYRLRRLSLMLPIAMMPGIAAAQTVIAVADLPPVKMAAKQDYGLRNLTQRPDRPAARMTPMLERLFAPGYGFGRSDHRHAATFAIGGIEVTTEAMRESLLTANGGSDRSARVFDRIWAAGAHADWAVGANDSLSLGVAADKDKRAEVAILPGRTHIKGSTLATELTWAHDDHLRMSLSWRADRTGASASGAERLVELAQGAALREQGFRLTLGYMLAGRDPSHNAMFGIAARDARVAAEDLAMIGPSNRQDVQAALFFRTLF